MFPSKRKRKAGVLKFLLSEERFRKAPFSWRISVDGRPNRRNKAVFSNFSGVLQLVDGASFTFIAEFEKKPKRLWLRRVRLLFKQTVSSAAGRISFWSQIDLLFQQVIAFAESALLPGMTHSGDSDDTYNSCFNTQLVQANGQNLLDLKRWCLVFLVNTNTVVTQPFLFCFSINK